MRLSPSKIDAFVRQGRIKLDDIAPALKKPNKYGAIPTADSTGRVHPSKLQATWTDRLRAAYLAVIPEVTMPIEHDGSDNIRMDVLAIERVNDDGSFVGRMIEIKGRDLPEGKKKRARFERQYGVPVTVLRKEDL